MNFNYVLYTGDSTISGSESDILERNRISFLKEQFDVSSTRLVINLGADGKKKKDSFDLDTTIVTGDHCSLVSLNSQTLFEGEEDINYTQRWNYYTLDSGDYFVDLNSGGNLFHFNSGLTLTNSDIVSYDKRDFSSGVMIYKTKTDSTSTALSNIISKAESIHFDSSDESEFFTNYDLFFNGQKAYSSSEIPSSLSSSEQPTGVLFGIHKKQNTLEIFSTKPDVYGSGYVDYQFEFYLNGMRQSAADVLQLYTGVSMVETGIQSSLSKYDLQISNNYIL